MYSIKVIAEKIDPPQVVLRSDEQIEYILTDSRSLTEPEHTVFFALRTATGNGHKYIDDLYRHGVRNFVVAEDASVDPIRFPKANILYVRDPLRALQKLAAAWRREFDIPVIAITGSNGKTVTKEFAYQLLSPHYNVVRSPRSYNSQLGVPLSVLKMDAADELAIFEAGISQPAEMDRIASIIAPKYGIFTNIGSAHQENFTDTAEKVDEKLQLFQGCEVIIYNADSGEIAAGLKRQGLLSRASGWSVKDPEAELFVNKIERKGNKTLLNFTLIGIDYTTEIPFTDNASIEDVLHCLLLFTVINPSLLERILEQLPTLEPVKMRLEVKEGNNGNIVINDTYNNDVNSLFIALDFLRLRASQANLKKVVILSDILQSSLTPKSLYRGVADMVKKYGCDLFIGIGKDPARNKTFFKDLESRFYPTTDDFLRSSSFDEFRDSAILVKGARAFRFERIVDKLAVKAHETTLEVNLQNLVANLKAYRTLLPEKTKIMAMVKANAYGIGAYEIAHALEEANIDFLAVAVADEGKELRKRGVLVPIVVMDPGVSDIDTLIDYNLEPVVHSQMQFDRLRTRIAREGFDDFPIHLELDTGMHRLGFLSEEADTIAKQISAQSILRVKSIFTHLAAADVPCEDLFTKRQISLYKDAYNKISKAIGYNPLRHVLNTAGCERFTDEALDLVRLGIGLYGVSPTAALALQPVVRLHTTLLQISKIAPQETIGYGRHGKLPNGGKIGIIPIGYADGYDRRFGCGVGKVVIRGKVYPTIGNICMDACMIDLSAAAEGQVAEGDEVTLLGSEKEIDIAELSRAIGTIPYEIIADLALRIKRVYYRE